MCRHHAPGGGSSWNAGSRFDCLRQGLPNGERRRGWTRDGGKCRAIEPQIGTLTCTEQSKFAAGEHGGHARSGTELPGLTRCPRGEETKNGRAEQDEEQSIDANRGRAGQGMLTGERGVRSRP